jgi:hypothetical protein
MNTVYCPHCETALTATPALAGQTLLCPQCDSTFVMPFFASPAPPMAIARVKPDDRDIVVKQYRSQKEYEKDAKRMRKRGYRVSNTVVERPRSSCARVIALGFIGALVFRPKSVLIVTYEPF